MNLIMIGNALIEMAWVAATVTLVIHGHEGWAVATFIMAIFCGYSSKSKS